MSTQVIAVAAPIGGGKSALVTALAKALGHATALRFDDYEIATSQSIEQLSQWLAAGADFDQLQAPGLANDLLTLRAGGHIVARGELKADKATSTTNGLIVFEMPLGRAWSATAAHIDLLIWVDVPLDIALARRISEIISDLTTREPVDLQRGLAWLNDYLAHYIHTLHSVMQAQRHAVRPKADLVLDGHRDISAMVDQVLQFMETRVD